MLYDNKLTTTQLPFLFTKINILKKKKWYTYLYKYSFPNAAIKIIIICFIYFYLLFQPIIFFIATLETMKNHY
jgi:hypothetical protein